MNRYILLNLADFFSEFEFHILPIPKHGIACNVRHCQAPIFATYPISLNHEDQTCPLCRRPCIHSYFDSPDSEVNPPHHDWSNCFSRDECEVHQYVCPHDDWFGCQKCKTDKNIKDNIYNCNEHCQFHYCQSCQIMFNEGCGHLNMDHWEDITEGVLHAIIIYQVRTPPPNSYILKGMPRFKSIHHYWELLEKGYDFDSTCTCCLQPEFLDCPEVPVPPAPPAPPSPCLLCHERKPHRHAEPKKKKKRTKFCRQSSPESL